MYSIGTGEYLRSAAINKMACQLFNIIMSFEHGRTEAYIPSVERSDSSGRLSLDESLLVDIENDITPTGSAFVDAVHDDPLMTAKVLDLICKYTGAKPLVAADAAKLFDFTPIKEVEYFFHNFA